MDHFFRNLPSGSRSPATSAAQQQEASQAAVGQLAYPLSHSDLPGMGSYMPSPQHTAFNSIQMPEHAPEQSYSVPSAVSFAPMLQPSLHAWTNDPSSYAPPAGEQAVIQQDHPAVVPQEWGAMPMQEYQGFIADPVPMPPAHALGAPPFMQQQDGDPARHSSHAPLPIINEQTAFETPASHPWAQPSDSSGAPGPSQRKHALAEASETDPRQAKRSSVGGLADIDYDCVARMPPHARLPDMAAWRTLLSTPDSVLSASGPGTKLSNTYDISQLAKAYKATRPPSRYPFAKKGTESKKGTEYYIVGYHKKILNPLGILYGHEVNEVLLACEKALGGNPEDGEHELPITGNGYTAYVFWRIKNHETALLTMAADLAQLKQQVALTKEVEMGKQGRVLARAGLMSSLSKNSIKKIRKAFNNKSILEELGYPPETQAKALRRLSNRCDIILSVAQGNASARSATQEGDSVSGTDTADVQHFKLARFGPQEKDVEALRWVTGNAVGQLLLFYKDGLADAVIKMDRSISLTLSQLARHQANASCPSQNPTLAQAPEGEVIAQPTPTVLEEAADPSAGSATRLSQARRRGGKDSVAEQRTKGSAGRPLNAATVGKIKNHSINESFLKARGYNRDDWEEAVRTIADQCDEAAQDGNSVRGTRIPNVQHFKFTKWGDRIEDVQALRWVEGNTVSQLLLFDGDGLEATLKAMQTSITRTLRARARERERASLPAPNPAGA